MTVHDARFARVVRRPIEAFGKPIFVELAGRLAIKPEFVNSVRAAPQHVLANTSVGDGKLAPIEPSVAWKGSEKAARAPTKILRRPRKIVDGFGKAVREFHVATLKQAHEPVIVIANNNEGVPFRDHVHDDAYNIKRTRSTIDQVTDEEGLSAEAQGTGVLRRL